MSLQAHPFAEVFPLIEGPDFDALVDDIRQHGLREPIVLHEGMILDGRNRALACQVANVDARYEMYTGDDPASYVVSLNLRRRHLDESQRSMAGKRLANLPNGHRKAPSSMELGGFLENPPPPPPRITQAEAAEMMNVSVASIKRAGVVLGKGIPELVEAVDRSKIAVRPAAEIARLPPEEQKAAVEKHVRGTFGTGENEWYTPADHIGLARQVLGGIDLDPASSEIANRTVNADRFFTIEDDGLSREWGGRVWLNPPYAQPAISHFADKMVTEVEAGRIDAGLMLTHNYTDTGWFHKLARAASAICFTRGRVRFVSPAGDLAAPTQGQAFFYFGADVARFLNVFGAIGFVVEVRR